MRTEGVKEKIFSGKRRKLKLRYMIGNIDSADVEIVNDPQKSEVQVESKPANIPAVVPPVVEPKSEEYKPKPRR